MGKLIVVTGGAGFVGSHLVRALVEREHRVIVLDNYFTGSRDNHVAGAEYREGHTKDIATLIPETPDLVYHLGEYSRVEKSFDEPTVVFDLNVLGTEKVLEYCRAKKVKLLYAGSSTKFADGGHGRDESPYAFSKATNTELVKNYGDWYGLTYAITYFYNVYGPGERAGAYGTVIEIFKQKRLAGEPIAVTSPGTQKRHFTHVDDIVAGLLLVGEQGEGDNFGIGDDQDFSILEVAQMFGGEIIMKPEAKGNRMLSGIDTARTRELGWKPEKHLPEYIHDILSA